jgi:hypothetical protein
VRVNKNVDTNEKPNVQEVHSKKSRPRWQGTRKGFFNPKNPAKYEGKVDKIIYRSKLELRIMKHLDTHPDVLKWSSEELAIPYVKPTDGKIHRYFVDFKATLRHKDGTVRTTLLEAKWSTACVPPKVPKKKTKRYMREVYNWTINQAKWDAAKKLCKKHDWDWTILTEKHAL